MGRALQRQRVQTCRRITPRKRRLWLGSADALPLSRTTTTAKVPHRSLHRNSKDERTVTTACPQPGTENGLQRPTDLEGQTRATHHGQERRSPPKGRIHLRRLVFSTKLPLAVLRRTIHSRYLSFLNECMGIYHQSAPRGEVPPNCRPCKVCSKRCSTLELTLLIHSKCSRNCTPRPRGLPKLGLHPNENKATKGTKITVPEGVG
jgi:hypothetical protein